MHTLLIKTKDHSSGHFLGQLQVLFVTIAVVYNSDGERATGALGDGLSLADIGEGDLELVAAGTGVVKGLVFGLEIEVLDLDLVVHFG